MNESYQDLYNNLMVELRDNSSELQIRIHDPNEYTSYLNSLTKVITLKEGLNAAFMIIRKIHMAQNCKDSPNYSYTSCIDNFIAEVF